MVHEIGQARREDPCVIELGDPGRAEVHRLRHVEQHREVRIRLRLVFLNVVAVGARPELPVHPADVVARNVAAVLGEIDRGAEVRRLVHAVDEPVDDRTRHELQVPDPREDRGIHEPRAWNGALRMSCCDAHISPGPAKAGPYRYRWGPPSSGPSPGRLKPAPTVSNYIPLRG